MNSGRSAIIEKKQIQNMADFFKVLSTPSRIWILLLLMEKESSVTELAGKMGMTQSSVSHQLNVLRINRLVAARREGRQILYRICDDTVRDLLLQRI